MGKSSFISYSLVLTYGLKMHNKLLTVFLAILFAPQALALICKFGRGAVVKSDETVRKYCVYYEEYPTDECNKTAIGRFGALSTLDEISGKCTAYHHTKHSHVVVACFCRTDGCNEMNSIVSLVRNSRQNPEQLPTIPGLWHVNPSFDARRRRELMRCLAYKDTHYLRSALGLKISQELIIFVVVVMSPIALFLILASFLLLCSGKSNKSKRKARKQYEESEDTSRSI
ncbi:hypothetical protein RB195_016403 [Necator americanus]